MEKLWRKHWSSKVGVMWDEEWARERKELMKAFLTRRGVLTPTGAKEKLGGMGVEERFTVEGALSLLEEVSGRLGVMGVILGAMVKTAREKGVNTPACLAVFREEDNVALVNLTMERMRAAGARGGVGVGADPGTENPLLKKAEAWAKELLDRAQKAGVEKPPTGRGLDLRAIARACQGKDSAFTIEMIKTALAYEGCPPPSLDQINALYLKVCGIQFDLTVRSGSGSGGDR